MKEYYKTFGIGRTSKSDKKKLRNHELYNLYLRPKKDKKNEIAHIYNDVPNAEHQADLLFMPNDEGNKYALVVVDVASRKTDAEPLKNKKPSTVLAAFKKIFNRQLLDKPRMIQVDSGTEFKGPVKQYFGRGLRVTPVGRHRAQGLVEARNKSIGTALFKRMTAQELLTGEPSTEWIEDLPHIIKALNKHLPKPPKMAEHVLIDNTTDLLVEGTKVRVQLDNPLNVHSEKRLHGRFRSTDIRWNPKVRIIRHLILKPGYPPLYLLDGDRGKTKFDYQHYTRNQLQVVHDDEEAPDGELVIRSKNVPKTYRIQKILGEKLIKGKKFLLIKWKGFKEETYEPYENIKSDQPVLVNEYENSK